MSTWAGGLLIVLGFFMLLVGGVLLVYYGNTNNVTGVATTANGTVVYGTATVGTAPITNRWWMWGLVILGVIFIILGIAVLIWDRSSTPAAAVAVAPRQMVPTTYCLYNNPVAPTSLPVTSGAIPGAQEYTRTEEQVGPVGSRTSVYTEKSTGTPVVAAAAQRQCFTQMIPAGSVQMPPGQVVIPPGSPLPPGTYMRVPS